MNNVVEELINSDLYTFDEENYKKALENGLNSW
jgi:hypothetical protein